MVNSLYQGMQYDPITDLYYGRARWYSTSLGRWISQDPAGYVNGANAYQFVMSDPIGRVDATGRAITVAPTSAASVPPAITGGLAVPPLAAAVPPSQRWFWLHPSTWPIVRWIGNVFHGTAGYCLPPGAGEGLGFAEAIADLYKTTLGVKAWDRAYDISPFPWQQDPLAVAFWKLYEGDYELTSREQAALQDWYSGYPPPPGYPPPAWGAL